MFKRVSNRCVSFAAQYASKFNKQNLSNTNDGFLLPTRVSSSLRASLSFNHKPLVSVPIAKDTISGSLPHFFNDCENKKSKVLTINPTCIVKSGEMLDVGGNIKNECYVLLHELRKDDKFPSTLSREKLIELFFPNTSSELALSLSNVTSVFYGIMLETCGKVIGVENINNISKDFFYKLGRVKTKITNQSVSGQFDIPKDARGVVILLVSAIYNASPEYKFKITQYSEDQCQIELHGVDRYYRISKTLNLEKKLQWPVLHTFLEGIKDELTAPVDIESEMVAVEDNGECHERFVVKRR